MIRIFNQYVSPKTALFIFVEGLVTALALLFGVRLRFWDSAPEFAAYVQMPIFGFQAALFVVTFLVCFHYANPYSPQPPTLLRDNQEQLICLGQSLGAASLFLGALYFIFPSLLIGRGVFFISTAILAGLVTLTRVGFERVCRAESLQQNIVIIGTGETAYRISREFKRRPDLGVRVVGLFEPVGGVLNGELAAAIEQHKVSRIIVALENRRGNLPVRELVTLRVQGVRVEDAHSALASLTGRVWLNTVQPSWFLFSDGFHRSTINLIFKRSLDLAVALIGLILSAPIMAAVALAIKLDSKGPIVYRQIRVGLRGKQFEVLKFRSMRQDAESAAGAQWATQNDPRVTRLGRILRKYRLDELPQFINVIRGEMSFVGPRPERPVFVDELRKVISYYDERHTVPPGLTGWAQVQYPYGSTLEDAMRKLEYDLFYLKNMSPFFDFAIILKTVRIVLAGWGGQ